jgi:hypothetical protein
MNQHFGYRMKYSWGFVWLAGFSVVCIAYSLMQPFNIRFRRLTLLEYPQSNYTVIGVGLLFVAYAVHRFLQIRAANSATMPISFTREGMSFPYIQGYKVTSATVHFPLVNELWSKSDEDDGDSVVLYVENNKYRFEFFAMNFESLARFEEFSAILEQHCTNITNRERPVATSA